MATWRQLPDGSWEHWGLERAEICVIDGWYFARLRHGGFPQAVGIYPTLGEAKAAARAECCRRRADAEEQARSHAAWVESLFDDDDPLSLEDAP